MARLRSDWLLLAVVAASALWIGVITSDAFIATVGATAALYAIAASGLNLVFGYAGDLSLGQGAFYAIGAYATVLIGNHYGATYIIAALLGTALAMLGSAIVGTAALRARGLYLAMITVASGLVVYSVAQGWIAVTGGPEGIRVERGLALSGRAPTPEAYLLLVTAVLVVVLWAVGNLARHHWGRAWKATQASRVAAEASGINTYRLRLTAFVIAGLLTGLAGALYTVQTGYITSDVFVLEYSVFVLLAVLVGGAGTIAGPVIGSAGLVAFLHVFGTSLGALTNFVYGALFILIIYVAPEGIVGAFSKAAAFGRRRTFPAARKDVPPESDAEARGTSVTELRRQWNHDSVSVGDVLDVRDVSKSFYGVHALDRASMTVKSGTVHGLIGANGSGKSTMLNVIMGIYQCDSGAVVFRGSEIQNRRPYRIARLGLARTFQTSELFKGLTVRANVMAASAFTRSDGLFPHAVRSRGARRREAAALAEADTLLELVGLTEKADLSVESLAPGQGRLLELARALATQPLVVVLDEPAAGLDGHEVETLAAALAAVREAGITVLIVEHRMELIAALADVVTVLERGRTIAHDTPRAIQENEAVISSYLGDIKLVS